MNRAKKNKRRFWVLSFVMLGAYLFFGYLWDAYADTEMLFILALSVGSLFLATRSEEFHERWEKWSAEGREDYDKLKAQTASKRENKKIIKCPTCHSRDVQFMQNNKKGFSVGKAVGGAALTGGIGTLAGFAGKKGKNEWLCTNCHTTFETK
ncbi:hypothetical protein [Enterococcus mundtii]|uniref:hypothetical protein n=1 Tax=Enterococcus mundtii TaxID=53346 RepID=UPI001929C3C9|nr:hypothetical protein [Enterococcus mundtii]NBA63677.1 hypothetical protein [Enterococcus mundtii]